MKILTAALLAFDAVILGYDFLQNSFVSITPGMKNGTSGS